MWHTYICMEIFYTASYYGKNKYQDNYNLVLKTLENAGVTVISPEKDNYMDLLSKKERLMYKDPNIRHYMAIRKGIMWTDATVVEISEQDFQLGHEATLAIQNKRHVLCLSVHEDFSKKIRNRYFHGGVYNKFNIEELIDAFLKKVKGEKLNIRFNMFVSESQDDYIAAMAERAHINKSEYIRILIDKDKINYDTAK